MNNDGFVNTDGEIQGLVNCFTSGKLQVLSLI